MKPIKVLGIHKDPWHNSGAAVICANAKGVEFATLSEERLDRVKDSRAFPALSTQACMETLGVESLDEFDAVVMDFIIHPQDWQKDHFRTPCSVDNFLTSIDPRKIHLVNHHLSHAYNVFYSSRFKDAAILIVDGRGSDKETQSLFHAKDGKIELIESTSEIGIGLLYAAVTQLIGFKILQEGKTMGLAPYGRNDKRQIFEFPQKYVGMITDYSDFCVEDSYRLKGTYPEMDSFEVKARAAYEIQEECERAMLHLARYARERTGSKNLCISGGVALNSVANYRVLMERIFDDVFINPAASDTGIPLGAALYGFHEVLKQPKKYVEISPYLGPRYSADRIRQAVDSHTGYTVERTGAFEKAAKFLAGNRIIGHFQGRSEMGPRALGNRSILMSPLVAENKDILNAKVKFREAFRPFAPAILAQYTEEYFIIDRSSPYMLFVPQVRPGKEKVIPAVTHVDGTGRLQTVTPEFNPDFYKIIESFHAATGVPVLLNTSFNVAGEAIVESPEDAIRCFLSTNIEGLLIGDFFLHKDPA